jgi:hypothetical protein
VCQDGPTPELDGGLQPAGLCGPNPWHAHELTTIETSQPMQPSGGSEDIGGERHHVLPPVAVAYDEREELVVTQPARAGSIEFFPRAVTRGDVLDL